ncbi:MAG TPA: hypothetical protein VK887_13840 [Pseudonocardiaceae bacterium]|nr:hypothetical protein [Pseudonocardiaceae bacterium]
MSAAEQLPETEQHRHRERDRLIALGRRSDSGERCTLLVTNEVDGSWSFHGLGAAVGVTLSKADPIAVAESIPVRAR